MLWTRPPKPGTRDDEERHDGRDNDIDIDIDIDMPDPGRPQ